MSLDITLHISMAGYSSTVFEGTGQEQLVKAYSGLLAKQFKDRSIAERYSQYYSHLDQATAPMPPLANSFVHSMLRTLGWSGHGHFTVTVPAGNGFRVAPNPGSHSHPFIHQTAVVGTGLASGTRLDVTGIASQEMYNPLVVAEPYTNLAPNDSGFGGAPGTDTICFAQLSGGYATITVQVPQGSECVCYLACQNDARGWGLSGLANVNTFQTLPTLDTMFSSGLNDNLYDYDITAAAQSMGGLGQLVDGVSIVGGSDTSKVSFGMPILPSYGGFQIQYPTPNASGFPADALWLHALSEVATAATGGNYLAYAVPPALGYTLLANPFFTSTAIGDITGLTTAIRYRFNRAQNNLVASALHGMPAFECINNGASGTVTVDVRFKMFWNLIAEKSHPMFDVALYRIPIAVNDIQHIRRQGTGYGGIGSSAKEAARNSRIHGRTAATSSSATGGHDLPAHYDLLEASHESDVIHQIKTGISMTSHKDGPGLFASVLGGLSSVGNAIKSAGSWLWDERKAVGAALQVAGSVAQQAGPPQLKIVGEGAQLAGAALEATVPKNSGQPVMKRPRVEEIDESRTFNSLNDRKNDVVAEPSWSYA